MKNRKKRNQARKRNFNKDVNIQLRKETIESGETFFREAEIDIRKSNNDTRTVSATLSSEIPVKRWFGNEVLAHDDAAINLDRASDGLPLLFNHNSDNFIGVVRNITVSGGKLRGDLQFSENSRASEVYADVSAGLLRNVSIGYRIHKYEESENGDIRITDWSLYEASIAPVPADHTVGVNRNHEGIEMKTEAEKKAEREAAELKAREAETARIVGVRAIFGDKYTSPKHIDLMAKCVTEGRSIEESQADLLDLIGKDSAPAGSVRTGFDADCDPMRGMHDALTVRFGIEKDKDKVKAVREKNEFGSFTLVDMARQYLQLEGVSMRGLDIRSLVGKAITHRATQVTTDFPELLANVAHVSLLQAYWDAPETWRAWARVVSLNDFKQHNRANISEFDTLPAVAEGANYTEGSFTDLSENITLATYGMNWSISREAIINDAADAFSRVPRHMGLAAARTVGNLAYGVLTNNALMNQDGVALFDAAHSNLVQAAVPLDAALIQAAKVAMALQKGPKGVATLGIQPAHLIVPVELEGIANTLMAAQYNPASSAGTLEPNPVQGLMNVISEHRLSADSAAQWYMAASASQWDTVEVAFLGGMDTPYQERRNDSITNDNITYKVRIDAAAAAMDFRGLYTHTGAVAPI